MGGSTVYILVQACTSYNAHLRLLYAWPTAYLNGKEKIQTQCTM